MPKKEEIKKVIHGEAHVRIGKSGITEGILREINRQLERLGIIKVKVLRSYLRSSNMKTKEIAELVARKVQARIVDVRGHTFILVKEK